MSRWILIALLSLVTVVNAVALAVNLSLPSRAAVAGMTHRQLLNDPDFAQAVKTVVEACNVNLDIGKVKC
jgi:hypothetical protein